MKFDTDPTWKRIILHAALVFLSAFLVPLYAMTSQNIMPTALQVCTFVIAGILSAVALLMTFITGSTTEESKPTPT